MLEMSPFEPVAIFNFVNYSILLHLLILQSIPTRTLSLCRNYCNNIPIKFPFSIDNGCGAPQYRGMLNCSMTDLFFQTPLGYIDDGIESIPSGTYHYKVQSIDYDRKTMIIYDPSMSTCSILQPPHDFIMSEVQSVIIPPTPDTVFALLNCSISSPLLNNYKSLCSNFSGHSCDELYAACTSFKMFHFLTNSTPPCCFTGYNTMKFMKMSILDCTHFTSVYNTDNLRGVGPLDWLYGMKLSFSAPDTGCDRCEKSGGTCGFDVQTEGPICICSTTTNSSRECAAGTVPDSGKNQRPSTIPVAVLMVIGTIIDIVIYDAVL